jgi:hypothetical protein
MSKFLEILASATSELSNSPHVSSVAVVTNKVLDQIKEIQSAISKKPELCSILIYICLRFLQEIDFLNVAVSIEDRPPVKQFPIVLSRLRGTLSPFFREGIDCSVSCGREFLRFGLDRPLICEFVSNFQVTQKYFGNPSPEFLHLLIPEAAQEKIQQLVDPALIPNVVQELIASRNPESVHFMICDLLRFCFSSSKITQDIKCRFILELLHALPNRDHMINTVEVGLCLCIDLFAFQRGVGDLSAIHAFFHVFRKYPSLLPFIDKVCVRHAMIPLAIAEAMAACNEVIPITSVVLPVVEIEPMGLDIQGILTQAIRKLRWQKNSPTVLAECSQNLLRAIMADGPCMFDLPLTRNEGLKTIIRAGNAAIIAAVCTKHHAILTMAMYELVVDTNLELLKQVLALVFESEVASWVIPALSKVLVLTPEFIDSMPEVIAEIPTTVDPSAFIRYLSYNCTMDEIATLTETVLFPSVDSQVSQLFKASLKWKTTVQSSFWVIVKRAFVCDRYTRVIITAFQALIKPLSEGQISSLHLKQILRRTIPSPMLSSLIHEMVRESENARQILIPVLMGWCQFFKDDTQKFVQNRANTFRTLYEGLSPSDKLRFPPEIKNLLQLEMTSHGTE